MWTRVRSALPVAGCELHRGCKEGPPGCWADSRRWSRPGSWTARSCPSKGEEAAVREGGATRQLSGVAAGHTYDPQAIERDLLVEPLEVVVPPLVRRSVREVGVGRQAGPHLGGRGYGEVGVLETGSRLWPAGHTSAKRLLASRWRTTKMAPRPLGA